MNLAKALLDGFRIVHEYGFFAGRTTVETTPVTEAAPETMPEPTGDSAAKSSENNSRTGVFTGLFIVVLLVVAAPWLRDRLAPVPIYVQEPGHEVTGHRYLFDENLGWRNIPDWSATTYGHKLTINSLGMRDREHERKKSAGTKRILVLGGSFTWGYGVADGENYTDVLEALLKRGRYEVLNTGVSGWGTDQEYLFLKNEGLDFEPDLVIAAFNLTEHPIYCRQSENFGLSKPMFLDTDLTLGNVPVPKPDQQTTKLTCEALEEELAIAILRRMAAVCDDHGCPLVVMKFGAFRFRHDTQTSRIQKLLQSLTERETVFQDALTGHPGLLLFDLDEAFEKRQLNLQSILEGNHDGHWNAFGHQQVGELLHEWLVELKLVETPRGSVPLETN